MTLKDSLTPKNTEEIKPEIFIQRRGDEYRVVHPIVWNNEWRLKKQFSWKNLIWIIILLFLVWSYNHDVKAYRSFYETVTKNPIEFCSHVNLNANYGGGDANGTQLIAPDNYEPST